jgi:tetratricopeptide (TPR) repeat protein
MRGAQVWIAMEFVTGRTLRDWARAQPLAELVRALTDVARGVAAAHAAGLVHRDLKPDNVMIDDEGRVRVMDFGLAHGRGAPAQPPTSPDAALTTTSRPESAALSARLTQLGSLQGTPAYMAPELWAGMEAEAASDQFAWCVMAWELVHGAPPFTGRSLPELAAAILAGRRTTAKRRTRVPGWLRAVLERGLSQLPAQRWPSMTALLQAMERGERGVRRRAVAAALCGVAALGGVVVGVRQLDVDRRARACEVEGAAIHAVWDDSARTRLRAGFGASGVSYGPSMAEKVAPWLDERTAAWTRATVEVCLGAGVPGPWDAELVDRAKWCLEDRAMEIESLVAELGRADPTAVRRSVSAAASLKDSSLCTDPRLLQHRPPLPAEGRERLQGLRASLAQAASRSLAGRFKEALQIVQEARARDEAIGWPPLLAAAQAIEGNLLEKTGAYDEAEAVSTAAYFAAARAGAWDVAMTAATDLIYIVGHRKGLHADAIRWADHAEVAHVHGGGRTSLTAASRLNNLATAHFTAGAYDEALRLNEAALAIRVELLGDEHPDVARGLNNLALTHDAMGSYADAVALHQRALGIRERTLGPEHLEVAESLNNLAATHHRAKANAAAKPLYARALAIRERTLGPDDLTLATSLTNLALIEMDAGRPAEARPLLERVVAVHERALGPDDHNLAPGLVNLAELHRSLGDDESARRLLERAVRIHERALGEDHPGGIAGLLVLAQVLAETGARAEARALFERVQALQEATVGARHPDLAVTLTHLADLDAADGAHARARALHERAQAIREEVLGPDHPDVALSLYSRAGVHLSEGTSSEALPLLERALKIVDQREEPSQVRPAVYFRLAEVSHAEDPARAVALARRARDLYREAGPAQRQALAEVERWMADRDGVP